MRRLGAALTCLLVAACLAGCGGSSDDDLADGFSVQAALGSLPKVSGSRKAPVVVNAADLDSMTEAAGLDRPRGGTDAVAGWVADLVGAKVLAVLPEDLGTRYPAKDVRKVLGFDVTDVSRFAAASTRPNAVTVVRLRDGAQLKKGVRATGKGPVGNFDRTAQASPGGGPFPFVLGVGERDGSVALAQRSSLLSAWKEGDATMAGDDHLTAVAKALDDHDVYAATLVDGQVRRPDLTPRELRAATGVPAYDAVGVAAGTDDGEPVVYVAYAPKHDDGAKDAIERVWRSGRSLRTNEPISSLVKVDDVTETDGVVVVTVRSERPEVVLTMIIRGDTPFFVRP